MAATLAGAVVLSLAPSTPVAAAAPTEAQQIIAIARQQLGDPWRFGATGPRAFDCSGLVIYAYTRAGDRAAIANGRYRGARALYLWFKARGLASRTNPKPGDLVVWGGGTHIGIYIGGGRAISTLVNGVRIHGVHAVTAQFTAYLPHRYGRAIGLGREADPDTHDARRRAVDPDHPRDRQPAACRRHTRSYASRLIAAHTRVTVLGHARDRQGRTWFRVRVGHQTGWVAGWLTR